MDRNVLYTKKNKLSKPVKAAKKSGVIFVGENLQKNQFSEEKVLKQVNNRIAQPVTETQMQTAKEGTSESMFNPSGGFERF